MTSFVADAGSYDKAGRAMAEASTDLAGLVASFFASVADVTPLGTNDVLGAVCSEVYRVAHEACQESAASVAENYGDFGAQLVAAGQTYRQVEDVQAASAAGMVNPGLVG